MKEYIHPGCVYPGLGHSPITGGFRVLDKFYFF